MINVKKLYICIYIYIYIYVCVCGNQIQNAHKNTCATKLLPCCAIQNTHKYCYNFATTYLSLCLSNFSVSSSSLAIS